ncbi:MAG: flagellar hook-length control protein FliK [Planctomycetota bacterium]
MNTTSLTIDNMLSVEVSTLSAPPATKPVPSVNATPYYQAPDNSYPSSNTSESITTDNISIITQKESIQKPKQDFIQTLRKTVKTESPQQNQKNTKPDKQYPTSELPSKANPAKSTSSPEIPITLGTIIKENATKIEPKTGNQLAQLIANLKDSKSNPVTGQADKSAEIKLQVPSDHSQVGIKTVIPGSFSNQNKLQTSLSNISNGISTTDTQPGKSKSNDDISASNGTVVPTKTPTNIDNAKELISEALFNTIDDTAEINEKVSILGTSVVAGSAKSHAPNGQKANPSTLFDSSNTTKEDKNLTDKFAIHNKEKISVLDAYTSNITKKDSQPVGIVPDKSIPNANFSQDQNKIIENNFQATGITPEKTTLNAKFSQVQNKIAGQDSQPVGIVPEKSTPNANFSQVQNKTVGQNSQPIGIVPEKTTPNTKITTDSKTTNTEITSESSNSNYKETSNTGNKFSYDSNVRNLNIADVQVSINQTKKHNSTTYNNNSNSDSEQILSNNNPVTSVAELSPNSAEGIRTVELPAQASPNNITAEIGKQILESIHSSFSQEGRNQQITVQLNPPELGKVLIKFQEQDNQITGLLEVSKTQTRIEIEQAIPQIVRSLQDSGIQIKRLDVVLSEGEQQEQGTLREQTLQNGWAQQRDSADSYTGGNNPDTGEINEWLINNKSYQNISELQESFTSNGSINMLI